MYDLDITHLFFLQNKFKKLLIEIHEFFMIEQ